ncbi:TlpA family protein disulfide reductase [Halpernia frigidisoli]|uniref:Thiol-disulfide isomerase or thioredoxin n=1 Tax=Halpernia frigidisoli TaxID=1125876 RepID=A0A1I3DZM3_9FLAO|nr:TlpA disulfide reductase family protein [Halpernia frigidisoli]SFH92182.1 Thiol-disulfide isomerase or thioredoxin [Halpernia frigidisoli]
MRKLILSVLVLGALSACKKEKKIVENNDEIKDSTMAVTTPQVSTASINLKEFSPAQVSDYLKNKENDTLYVTNFFATWCGPCMAEIPHFKEKIAELKGQPVKFTFVDIDEKSDWDGAVKTFAAKNDLQDHIILVDNKKLDPAFFKSTFEKWDGQAIPYTIMKKGKRTEETLGNMSAEMLDQKLASFISEKKN